MEVALLIVLHLLVVALDSLMVLLLVPDNPEAQEVVDQILIQEVPEIHQP